MNPKSEEERLLQQLVGGIDICPDGSQYRALFLNIFAKLRPEEQTRTLHRLLSLGPWRRDMLLATMLWCPDEQVREPAVRFVLEEFSALPDLVWRAMILAKPLRDRLTTPRLLTPPSLDPGRRNIPSPPCRDCRVSIPDGSGHVTLFLALDQGGVPRTALALLHVQRGFVDVETMAYPSREARDAHFREICADLDVSVIKSGDVHNTVRDLFSLSLRLTAIPPPMAVDLLSLLWREDVLRLARGYVHELGSRQRRKKPEECLKALEEESVTWVKHVPLLESWMSPSALETQMNVDGCNKLEHIYFRMEEERPLWLANMKWAATILGRGNSAEQRIAQGLMTMAHHVEAGAPLRDLAFFRQIALRTALARHIEAQSDRQTGSRGFLAIKNKIGS